MHNQMWLGQYGVHSRYAFVGTLPPSMHVIHIASIRWHSEIPRARKDMYCRDGLVVFLYYPAAAKVISADVLSR
jgi:hypothetical protein